MIIYDLIFDKLKEELKKKRIEIYAPNSHQGNVVNPYIVLKETSTTKYQNLSSTITYFDILCYAKNYTDCLKIKKEVKEIMQNLQPTIMPTFNENEAYFDNTVKGYMSSVEYRNYKKITFKEE